MKLNWEMKNKL